MSFNAHSQSDVKNTETIQIKTNAICSMCKNTIEDALKYAKGVVSADLDVKTKIATVVYRPKKTNPDLLRAYIANEGYDADNFKAVAKKRKKLPECCKDEKACSEHN